MASPSPSTSANGPPKPSLPAALFHAGAMCETVVKTGDVYSRNFRLFHQERLVPRDLIRRGAMSAGYRLSDRMPDGFLEEERNEQEGTPKDGSRTGRGSTGLRASRRGATATRLFQGSNQGDQGLRQHLHAGRAGWKHRRFHWRRRHRHCRRPIRVARLEKYYSSERLLD